MPERFSGRLWHALKRYLGPEVVSLIAQALAGQGIRLHWDFLTETPLHSVLPELAARGIPEDEWPDDSNDNGSDFDAGYFCDRYGHCRDGCDTSSESDGETFELGPRPRTREQRFRREQRRRLHAGWRFRFYEPAPVPRIHIRIEDRA